MSLNHKQGLRKATLREANEFIYWKEASIMGDEVHDRALQEKPK